MCLRQEKSTPAPHIGLGLKKDRIHDNDGAHVRQCHRLLLSDRQKRHCERIDKGLDAEML